MSFVAANGTDSAQTISNNGFWPDLELSTYRDAMRVDNVATAERAAHALEASMLSVNRRLLTFQRYQQDVGHEKADEIPARPGERAGDIIHLYKRAVWNLAKAELIERYRDYDATGDGHGRADALGDTVDDHRRYAAWAIQDIKGEPRTTVELI
ncbi:MAG: head completion/stabilization protein [Ectothiorhodospiraceae bacterium]|nr:head completion/stabilization protein [Ectothiorhodospiraceae bacterium]